MLRQMRKKKTQVLKGTLILVIPAFVFFYGWSAVDERQRQQTDEFARVKTEGLLARWETIDRVEMLRAGEALRNRQLMEYNLMGVSQAYQFMQGSPDKLFSHAEILREALNQRIIRKRADELGIIVTEKDIHDEVIRRFSYEGNFSKAYFENEVRQNGLSEDQYLARVRDQLVAGRVMESFVATGKLSLFEVWQEYTLHKERIQLEFVKLDAAKYKKSVLPEEDELLAYFKKNIERYRIPDRKKYSYVAVTRKMVEQATVVTDDDAKAFYEENKDTYAAFQSGPKTELRHIVLKFEDPGKPVPADEMRAKIDEIAEKAKAEGADFAALADELSDDKAREGGYLGFVGGSFDEAVYGQAFVKRAMELTEDNPIAGPVQSPIGMHVLKFQSRKESETLPYASVQALAKEAATTKLINEELERRQKALAEAADTTTTFEGLAEQLGTEKFARKTTVFKNVDHMLIDLDVGSLARDKEFIETLEVGELSEVLTGAGGSLCLVVDEFQESHLPEMDETREAVIRDFTHDRALELAEADALEGVEMVKAEEGGLDAWAEQKGLEIVTTEFFERRSSPKELSETIDNLSNLTYKTPIGAIRMAALSLGGEQTGWIVWRIKDIDKPSSEQWEKDRATFQQQLLLMKQWTLFEEWLADARQAWQVELANQEG